MYGSYIPTVSYSYSYSYGTATARYCYLTLRPSSIHRSARQNVQTGTSRPNTPIGENRIRYNGPFTFKTFKLLRMSQPQVFLQQIKWSHPTTTGPLLFQANDGKKRYISRDALFVREYGSNGEIVKDRKVETCDLEKPVTPDAKLFAPFKNRENSNLGFFSGAIISRKDDETTLDEDLLKMLQLAKSPDSASPLPKFSIGTQVFIISDIENKEKVQNAFYLNSGNLKGALLCG